MTAAIPSCLQALESLPPGATLMIPDVSENQFLRLAADLESVRPGVRLTYVHRRLYAVSPLSTHELFTRTVDHAVYALAGALHLDCEPVGSMTLQSTSTAAAVEPDAAFYLANAAAIRGHHPIHLATHPPPDLVVEIDLSGSSSVKLPIYAALGIPEVWLYDGVRATILGLGAGEYRSQPNSTAFPPVTPSRLEQLFETAPMQGTRAAVETCKTWLAEAAS